MDEAVISARDLQVADDRPPITMDVTEGLTLLIQGRESHATELSLVLGGRVRPRAGSVASGGETLGPRKLFKRVALAGAPEIDTLERATSAKETIREQIAWAQPWYKPTPKDPMSHALAEPWLEPLALDIDPKTAIGNLRVIDRIRVRVLCALIARPDADLLIVDDIDQLRAVDLRDELLTNLKAVAEKLPVIASSVNPDAYHIADTIIDLRER